MFFDIFRRSNNAHFHKSIDEAIAQANHYAPELFDDYQGDDENKRLQRFQLISIFIIYQVWKLGLKNQKKQGLKLQQVFYDRCEISLREAGVSDVRIGPKVRQLAGLYSGALKVYKEVLNAGDKAVFQTVLVKNTGLSESICAAIADQLIEGVGHGNRCG